MTPRRRNHDVIALFCFDCQPILMLIRPDILLQLLLAADGNADICICIPAAVDFNKQFHVIKSLFLECDPIITLPGHKNSHKTVLFLFF